MKPETTNERRQTKRRQRVFKLFLVLIGLFFGLLAAEICLRVVGYSYPQFYQADESRGYALIPNLQGWYRKEGESFVSVNSDGLRDEEHATEKPADVFRIAIIGDSYSEAMQVPVENAYWRVMKTGLEACGAFGGRRIETINFGVSGYGTTQELVTLREKAWRYSPDMILLAVTTNNDATDNLRHFKKTPIPYYVYRDGELVLDESFRDEKSFRLRNSSSARLGAWLHNRLRFVQAVHQIQVALKYRYNNWRKSGVAVQNQLSTRQQTDANPSPAAPLGDTGIDNLVYRLPTDEHWTEAWRVTEGVLSLMKTEVENHRAKFLVVTLSNGVQVHPNAGTRAEFAKSFGAEDLFYPDRRFKNWGDAENVEVINLAPDLLNYAERNQVFLHGFGADLGYGHWNAEGHRAAGETLADKVCRSPQQAETMKDEQ